MNDTTLYLIILAISAGLAVYVGHVLFSSGEPFLAEVFADQPVAASVNRLLAVLFHLLTLGTLAVISTIDIPVEGTAQTAVTKLGVVSLVVGGAHGIAMRVLLHVRRRRRTGVVGLGQPAPGFPPPGAGYPPPPGYPYPPAAGQWNAG